jgi:hypothetical protein
MVRAYLSWVFTTILLSAGVANAQTNVGVLEFDGNGTKEFLAEGSKAIRETIVGPRFESKYTVSSGDKISKLTLLLNCNTVDNTCLKKISDGLKANILIFGEVKQPTKGSYDVEMTMFNGTSTTNIRQKNITASQFAPVVSSLASELLGVPPLAFLDLTSNVPTAIIEVDGTKQDKPLPMRLELPPGVHKIKVSAPTYTTVEQDVEFVVGSPKSITIALSKEGRVLDQNVPPLAKALQWGGATGVALGAGMIVVFTIGSSRAQDLVDGNNNFDPAATGLTPEQERALFNNNPDGLNFCSAQYKDAVKTQRDNPAAPEEQLSAEIANKLLFPCYTELGGIPGGALVVGGLVSLWSGIRLERAALKGQTKGKEKVSIIPYIDPQNAGVVAKLRW